MKRISITFFIGLLFSQLAIAGKGCPEDMSQYCKGDLVIVADGFDSYVGEVTEVFRDGSANILDFRATAAGNKMIRTGLKLRGKAVVGTSGCTAHYGSTILTVISEFEMDGESKDSERSVFVRWPDGKLSVTRKENLKYPVSCVSRKR